MGITIGIITTILLFLNLSPQFGEDPTTEQKKEYAKLENYINGNFVNQNEFDMKMDIAKLIKKITKEIPNREPNKLIKINKVKPNKINTNKPQIIWFGHSTFLLILDGKKILIDPMFGDRPSPIPFMGPERYSNGLPIEIKELPFIDAVILSHDHYDHLDYPSIKKLKGKVGKFYAPIGVGNHLISWGVKKENIEELNWWEKTNIDSIELINTPAQHFSGRGLFNRYSTLWSSWVIKGKQANIYFSGDGGYSSHFKEIGEKYGPFDLSLMECGQYSELWEKVHMTPEETVQAAIDIKSKLTMPIHWGAFTLAFHSWTDSVERMTKKAKELNVPVITPKIGESFIIKSENYQNNKWWVDLK